MKATKTLFLICFTAVFFASCQKEVSFQDDIQPQPGGGNGGGTNSSDITGEWNFVWSHAITYAGLSFSDMGQDFETVTVSDYVTESNAGTLTVSNNQFIFKGISHVVNDEATSKTYINGTLFNEVTQPFNATYPPTDETRDYVRNDNDSLTFLNVVAQVPDPLGGGTSPVPTGPLGGKISLVNDTLAVLVKYATKQTITQAGIPATFDVRMEGTMKFKRK